MKYISRQYGQGYGVNSCTITGFTVATRMENSWRPWRSNYDALRAFLVDGLRVDDLLQAEPSTLSVAKLDVLAPAKLGETGLGYITCFFKKEAGTNLLLDSSILRIKGQPEDLLLSRDSWCLYKCRCREGKERLLSILKEFDMGEPTDDISAAWLPKALEICEAVIGPHSDGTGIDIYFSDPGNLEPWMEEGLLSAEQVLSRLSHEHGGFHFDEYSRRQIANY